MTNEDRTKEQLAKRAEDEALLRLHHRRDCQGARAEHR